MTRAQEYAESADRLYVENRDTQEVQAAALVAIALRLTEPPLNYAIGSKQSVQPLGVTAWDSIPGWFSSVYPQRAIKQTNDSFAEAAQEALDADHIPLDALRDQAVDLVDQEHDRQHEKWGTQDVSLHEWMTILTEEVGEVAMGINDKDDESDILKEIIQVAAVAVAWAERLIAKGVLVAVSE